ncbi:sigma-54-dependent Fis family transcriptional regulator [Aromatoleum anaerobium]|uniref:GAF domain-containing protein n=1 Tax=Aromatoleum anaerobium TaxID=182180 RepID=A0ABX1PPW3_9RHOO|nr:GAF domain-containing protein [Aromatoleum anaerobium]MCK0505860.1 sigma 54-interacting transcriptional regulator [Aromatoleum anaerobium]
MSEALPALPSSPVLRASWLRSREHGLAPDQHLPDGILARTDFAEHIEANARLLAFSRPAIENLYRQIGGPSSMVLLADERGLILSALGNTEFLDRAARVALSPGAEWSEASVGTNAIGTALHTGHTVAVRGAEHYLDRNRFLTCIATPILAPGGGMLGILDVSTDVRANISHAGALLRTTAELIEHSLIEHLEGGFVTIRFHSRAELVDGPLEALAVFDEERRLVASNRAARSLLKLDRAHPSADFDHCFATGWATLLGLATGNGGAFPLRAVDGRSFVGRAALRDRSIAPRAPRPPPAQCAGEPGPGGQLAQMSQSDPRVAAAIATLRANAAAHVPLLIEGETGTGKTHLIRAFHADHRRHADAPLVIIDGSSLHGAGASAELADRLGQAAEGTLFVVEIDALPNAMQRALFGTRTSRGATRIIAATRKRVAHLADSGRLELAHFAAAGGLQLSLPPLRERDDFDELVRLFVREACPERAIHVSPDALTLLRRHRWPGNLSELRSQLRLTLALMGDNANELCPQDIPPELFDDDSGENR